MFLIGLSGKMGCGKDYIANKYIIPYLESKGRKTMIWSFADQIKVNAMVKYNITYKNVYIEKSKFTRTLLQKEGTEFGRDKYGKDIWIKYLDAWSEIMGHKNVDALIITDVRFLNEIEYIKGKKGMIIRIDADDRNEIRLQKESNGDNNIYTAIKTHISECELDKCTDFDYVINNRTDNNINEVEIFEKLEKFILM
jgi:phosphomevalonate kinase